MDFHFSSTFVLIFFTSRVMSHEAVYHLTPPVDHGEGPVWDDRKGLLYFVSISEGKLLSFDFFTHELHNIQLDGTVSVVVPSKYDPNLLVIGWNRSVATVEWDGKQDLKAVSVRGEFSRTFPTSRFNDGKADSMGRLWFGTIGYEDSSGVKPNEGILYLITKETIKNPIEIIKPVTVSNGLAWSKNNEKFFYIDSPTFQVKRYDYDSNRGSISNPSVIFDLSTHPEYAGVPDGMTIDKDDNLWIALYGGDGVLHVDSKNGKILRFIVIPATYVTSVSWGGPSLDVLFVTTSRLVLNKQQRLQQPGAGSLFAVKHLGTNGLPVFEADIMGF